MYNESNLTKLLTIIIANLCICVIILAKRTSTNYLDAPTVSHFVFNSTLNVHPFIPKLHITKTFHFILQLQSIYMIFHSTSWTKYSISLTPLCLFIENFNHFRKWGQRLSTPSTISFSLQSVFFSRSSFCLYWGQISLHLSKFQLQQHKQCRKS